MTEAGVHRLRRNGVVREFPTERAATPPRVLREPDEGPGSAVVVACLACAVAGFVVGFALAHLPGVAAAVCEAALRIVGG